MLRNSSSVLFVKFLKYDIEIDIYIDIDIASKISVRKIDLIGIIDIKRKDTISLPFVPKPAQ